MKDDWLSAAKIAPPQDALLFPPAASQSSLPSPHVSVAALYKSPFSHKTRLRAVRNVSLQNASKPSEIRKSGNQTFQMPRIAHFYGRIFSVFEIHFRNGGVGLPVQLFHITYRLVFENTLQASYHAAVRTYHHVLAVVRFRDLPQRYR